MILLINDFSSCTYGDGKAIRCSLVYKTTLRHTDRNPYCFIILENKGWRFKGSDSKTEKLQFDQTITITCSLCLKSQTEVESCAIVQVIKSPRAQNTFCLDDPGNSESSAQVSHFKITQGFHRHILFTMLICKTAHLQWSEATSWRHHISWI